MLDAGLLLVTQDNTPSTHEFRFWQGRRELFLTGQVVQNRLGLDRCNDCPDGADQGAVEQSIDGPDGVRYVGPSDGGKRHAGTKGGLRLVSLVLPVEERVDDTYTYSNLNRLKLLILVRFP